MGRYGLIDEQVQFYKRINNLGKNILLTQIRNINLVLSTKQFDLLKKRFPSNTFVVETESTAFKISMLFFWSG